MSKAIALVEFNGEQIALIKATVAKGASDSELKLFLYRCQNMGLDPLRPGQVHFIKYGSNPGTIVVGIDGFRSLAARSGKLVGIKRGVLRDNNNQCTGAWCEVYRSDWQHPAREEVALAEYDTKKNQWAKMPETMIKKVAEAAALRMAFPDDLGGLYAEEELHQASRDVSPAKANQVNEILNQPDEAEEPDFMTEAAAREPETLGAYVIPIGQKYRGKRLDEIAKPVLSEFAKWVEANIQNKSADAIEFLEKAKAYLEQA